MPRSYQRLAQRAGVMSERLSWVTDRVCAALLLILVLDVWLGVLVRYVIPLPITFTEEAARYLMIWTALLAVSSGISRREHIGVQILFEALPLTVRKILLAVLDLLAFCFFLLLVVYGFDLVEKGASRFTMIYGVSKALPLASVPVAAALACAQLILVAIRDQASFHPALGEGTRG